MRTCVRKKSPQDEESVKGCQSSVFFLYKGYQGMEAGVHIRRVGKNGVVVDVRVLYKRRAERVITRSVFHVQLGMLGTGRQPRYAGGNVIFSCFLSFSFFGTVHMAHGGGWNLIFRLDFRTRP